MIPPKKIRENPNSIHRHSTLTGEADGVFFTLYNLEDIEYRTKKKRSKTKQIIPQA